MQKRNKTLNYKRGRILVKELQKSGQMLMSGSFCYAYFIYQQIELNLRSAVEKAGESNTEFITTEVDLSNQNFTQYYFDLSVFSSFAAYDRCEEEQWLAAGYSLDDLEHLRTAYLFGERWSDRDKGGFECDRGFTISLIISLSVQLSDKFVQFSKEGNVPLQTVISIFRGLWDKDHQTIELEVDATDSENLKLEAINSIAHKIHDIFLEYLSLVALSVSIELVWIIAVIDQDKDKDKDKDKKSKRNKENIIRNFLRRHCFHACCDEQFLQLKGESLVQYIQDRYLYVKNSFHAFHELLLGFAHKKGIHSQLAAGAKGSEVISEDGHSYEGWKLGEDIVGKITDNMFTHKYKLQGNSKYIIAYFATIIGNLTSDFINEQRYADSPVKHRTIQRYRNELPKEELTLEKIIAIADQKEENSKHRIDGFNSQNVLIETILQGAADKWIELFDKQGIKYKKLSRKGFQYRLNRLESDGNVLPDRIVKKGSITIKYYRATPDNMMKIARAVATLKRKKKKPQTL